MGRKYFVVILLGGLCLSSFADPLFPNAQCAELLRAMVLKPLSDDQTKLLETMAAELGMRVVDGVEMDADGTLRFPDAAHGAIRIRFVSGLTEPRFSDGLLELPPGTRLAKLSDGGKALLRRTFLGHRLYPFLVDPTGPHIAERIARGEPALVHREVQRDVIEVGRALLDAFAKQGRPEDQSLLAVSPTGTGKSEMVRALLRHRLAQSKRGLFIVMSDYGTIVDQLHEEVVNLNNGTTSEAAIPLRIIRWGDGHRHGADAKNLAELVELARTSDIPVVLVTTAASFRAQVGAKKVAGSEEEFEIDAEKLAVLRGQLRYWVYDEAHHAGAMQIGRIFDASMQDNPNAAALFVTATPDVRVQKMAGGRGFYTYLDRPQSWLGDRKSAARSPGEAVLQLRAAFDAGDLVGFDEVRPLIFARTAGEQVFKGEEGKRAELDEGHYGSLFAQTRNSLETRSTLISANTQREAIRVAGDLQRRLLGKGRVVAVVTSDFEGTVSFEGAVVVVKPATDVLARFRRGEIHVLVSVDKLNEGVDLPIASALVDLRNSPDPTALLQRLGRLTRTAPGKRDTEVYLAQAKTKEELIAALNRLARDTTGGAVPYRLTPEGYLVVATGDTLPRVLEANRLDFWNASPSREMEIDDAEGYQPLLTAMQRTFRGSMDFSRVTDRLRAALPEAKRAEWDRQIALILPTYPSLLAIARQGDSPGSILRVVRVLELYARLQDITVPNSRFREAKDHESLFLRFGYTASLTPQEVTSYLPLLDALSSTFKAKGNNSRVLDGLRTALPAEKRDLWDEGLSHVEISPGILDAARNGAKASTERVVWVVEFYARLQGIEASKSHFRDPKDFEPLLARFGYTTFAIPEAELATYQPLLKALSSTFTAAKNFSRVLEAFRAALPEERRSRWDEELPRISPRFGATLLSVPSAAQATQIVRVVELYAHLQGIEGAECHFRESADIDRLLAPFGYTSFSVTREDVSTYEPLLAAVAKTFKASKNFSKVLTSLRANLSESDHEAWDRRLNAISSNFSDGLLRAGREGGLKQTEECVRVLELYAKLKGIPIPENHFRDEKDYEPLLAPFRKR